jgi:hypothetical protein
MNEKKVEKILENIEKLDEALPKEELPIREKKQTQGRNKVVSTFQQEIPNFRFSGYLDIPIPRKVTDQRKKSLAPKNEELEALRKEFGDKQMRKRGGSVRVTEPLVNIADFKQIIDIKNSLLNSQLKSQIQGNNDFEEHIATKNFVAIRKLKQNLSKKKEEIKDNQFTQKLLKTVQKEKGKSTGYRPEAFLYTLKKINLNNKLDPEVGKISMQIHRWGTTGKVLPQKLRGLSHDRTSNPLLDKSAPFLVNRRFLPAKLSKETEDKITNLKRKCSSVKQIEREEIKPVDPSKLHKKSKEFDDKIVDKSVNLSEKKIGSFQQHASMIPQKQVGGSEVNEFSLESEEEIRERFETYLKVKDPKKATNVNKNNPVSTEKDDKNSRKEKSQLYENEEFQIKLIVPDSQLQQQTTFNMESKDNCIVLSNLNESAVVNNFKSEDKISKYSVVQTLEKGKFLNLGFFDCIIDPIDTPNLTKTGNLFVKIIDNQDQAGKELENSKDNVDKSVSFNVGTDMIGTQRFDPKFESKKDDSIRLDYSFNPDDLNRKTGSLNSEIVQPLKRAQTVNPDTIKKQSFESFDQKTPENLSKSHSNENQIVENTSDTLKPQKISKNQSSSQFLKIAEQTITTNVNDALNQLIKDNQGDLAIERKQNLKLTNDLKETDFEKKDSSGIQKNDDFKKVSEREVDRLMHNLRNDDIQDSVRQLEISQQIDNKNDEVVEQKNLKNAQFDFKTNNPVFDGEKTKNELHLNTNIQNESVINNDNKIEPKNEGISLTVPLKQSAEQVLASKVLEHSQKMKSKTKFSPHKLSSNILNFSKKSQFEVDDDLNRQEKALQETENKNNQSHIDQKSFLKSQNPQFIAPEDHQNETVANLKPNPQGNLSHSQNLNRLENEPAQKHSNETVKEKSSFGLLSFLEVKHNEYFDDLVKQVDGTEKSKSSKALVESQNQKKDSTGLEAKSQIKDDTKIGFSNIGKFKEDQNDLNNKKKDSKIEETSGNKQDDSDKPIKSNFQGENSQSFRDRKSVNNLFNNQNQTEFIKEIVKSFPVQQSLLDLQNAYMESMIGKLQNEINEVNEQKIEDVHPEESSKKDFSQKIDSQKSANLQKSAHIAPQEALNLNVNVSQNESDADLQTNLSFRNKYLQSLIGKLQTELIQLDKKANKEVSTHENNQIQKSNIENPVKNDLQKSTFIYPLINSYLQNLIKGIQEDVAQKKSEEFAQKQNDFSKKSDLIKSSDEKKGLTDPKTPLIENVDLLKSQSMINTGNSFLENEISKIENEIDSKNNQKSNVHDQKHAESVREKEDETYKSDSPNENAEKASNDLSIIDFQKKYIQSLIEKIQKDVLETENKSQLIKKGTTDEDKNQEKNLQIKSSTEINEKLKVSQVDTPVKESMIGLRSAYLKSMTDKLQEQLNEDLKKEESLLQSNLNQPDEHIEELNDSKLQQKINVNAPVKESMIGLRSAYLKSMTDKLQEQLNEDLKKEESLLQSNLNQPDEHIEELNDSKLQQKIDVNASVKESMIGLRSAYLKSMTDKLQEQLNEDLKKEESLLQSNLNQPDEHIEELNDSKLQQKINVNAPVKESMIGLRSAYLKSMTDKLQEQLNEDLKKEESVLQSNLNQPDEHIEELNDSKLQQKINVNAPVKESMIGLRSAYLKSMTDKLQEQLNEDLKKEESVLQSNLNQPDEHIEELNDSKLQQKINVNAPVKESMIGLRSAYLKSMTDKLQEQLNEDLKKEESVLQSNLNQPDEHIEELNDSKLQQTINEITPAKESIFGMRSAYLKSVIDKLQEQLNEDLKKEESVLQSNLNSPDEHIEELNDSKLQQKIDVNAPVKESIYSFRSAYLKSMTDKLQEQLNEDQNSSPQNQNQIDTKDMNESKSFIFPLQGYQTPSSLSALSQNQITKPDKASSVSKLDLNRVDQASYVSISSPENSTNFIPIATLDFPILENEVQKSITQSFQPKQNNDNNIFDDFETHLIYLKTDNPNFPCQRITFDNKAHDFLDATPNCQTDNQNYSLNYFDANLNSTIRSEKNQNLVSDQKEISVSQPKTVEIPQNKPVQLTNFSKNQTELPTMLQIKNENHQNQPNNAFQDPIDGQQPIEKSEHEPKPIRISFVQEEPLFIVEPSLETDEIVKTQLVTEEEPLFQRQDIVGSGEEPETPTFQFLKNPNDKNSSNKWNILEPISEKEMVNVDIPILSIDQKMLIDETPSFPLKFFDQKITTNFPIVRTESNFVISQSQSEPLLKPNKSNKVADKPQLFTQSFTTNEPSFLNKLISMDQKCLQLNDPEVKKFIEQQKILEKKRGSQIHTIQVPDLDVKCDVQNKELTKTETSKPSKSQPPNIKGLRLDLVQQKNESIPFLSKKQLKIEKNNFFFSKKLDKTNSPSHPIEKPHQNASKISILPKINLQFKETNENPNSKIRRTIDKQNAINYRNEPKLIEVNTSYLSDNSLKKSSIKNNRKSPRSKKNPAEINKNKTKDTRFSPKFKKSKMSSIEINNLSSDLSISESRLKSIQLSKHLDPSISISESVSNISFDSSHTSQSGDESKRSLSEMNFNNNSKQNISKISQNSFNDHIKRNSVDEDLKNRNEASGKFLFTASEKEAMKKLNKKSNNLKKAFSTAGFCCFLFFFSFLTTVFLFKKLDDKIGQLNSLILEPPTIKNFFDEYKKCFLGYEGSREFIKQVVTEEKNSEKYFAFQDYNAEIAKIKTLKSELNKEAIKLKMVLSSYQSLYYQGELLPVFNGRLLESKSTEKIAQSNSVAVDDNSFDDSEFNSSRKNEMALLTSRMSHKIDLLKDSLRSLQQGQSSQITYFQNLVSNYGIKMIEIKKLLDWFGNLYTLSNRIWVMSDNIYQEAKSKFKVLNKEFKKDLYLHYYSQVDNLKLSLGDYVKWGRIDKFQGFKIQIDRPAVLFCQIQAKYASKDSSLVSQMFDFTLVTNDKIDKNSIGFEMEVSQKKEVFNVKSILPLEIGDNDVSLFAQVKKEKVEFVYVSAKCLLIKEIKTIK